MRWHNTGSHLRFSIVFHFFTFICSPLLPHFPSSADQKTSENKYGDERFRVQTTQQYFVYKNIQSTFSQAVVACDQRVHLKRNWRHCTPKSSQNAAGVLKKATGNNVFTELHTYFCTLSYSCSSCSFDLEFSEGGIIVSFTFPHFSLKIQMFSCLNTGI